ncbi:MAG: hypothetical protein ACREVZ_01295 [Burkholderiales bacterium]
MNRNITLIDSAAMQPASRQRCPWCHTIAPPYGFHFNGADLGMIGTTKYFTIFCAAELALAEGEKEPGICGAILAVQMIEYQPPSDPAKLAALAAAIKGGNLPRA